MTHAYSPEAQRLAAQLARPPMVALARVLQRGQREDDNEMDDGVGVQGQWEAMMVRL